LSVDAQRLWAELAGAVQDRTHGWRLPVLATVAADGAPDARTVVLREVNTTAQRLTVFGDARSPKVLQLVADPRAVLVFWCPKLRWQLRVAVRATAVTQGERIQALWDRLQGSAAAGDYLSPLPPGTPFGAPASTATAPHLCILDAQVQSLDWLSLAPDGAHERVLFRHGRAQPIAP
jgi:pyridoxamine 5'-phosphate oxidase